MLHRFFQVFKILLTSKLLYAILKMPMYGSVSILLLQITSAYENTILMKGVWQMDLHLKNKVIVITGGTAGIGKACALEFLKEGANVIVCSRSEENIQVFLTEMQQKGFSPSAFSVDVSKEDEIQAFFETVGKTYGSIDVLCNNAGIGPMSYLTQLDRSSWDQVIHTNLTSVWLAAKYAFPFMKEHGGSIISTASLAARIATTSIGVYGISKSGVVALTRLLASELAPYRIRVNAVSPGVIESDMVRKNVLKNKGRDYLSRTAALQRLGTPEEVAKPVVFLASDAASFITGEILDISGGKFIVQDPWAPWEDFGITTP